MLSSLSATELILIPVNFLEPPENIKAAIYHSDLDGIIVEEKYRDKVVGNFNIADKAEILKEGSGSNELKDFTEEEKDNLALIIFTSGTTSLSKGFMLSAGIIFMVEFFSSKVYLVSQCEKDKNLILGLIPYSK